MAISHSLNLIVIVPEIYLLLIAVMVLMVDSFASNEQEACKNGYILSMTGLLGAALLILLGFNQFSIGVSYWNNQVFRLYHVDLFKVIALILTAAGFYYGRTVLKLQGLYRAEFFALLLFSALGMMVLISAATLLGIYLGLELMSLAMYSMVAMQRDNRYASEAAMKYFVMGAMASGFLLYGMALLYGATGTLVLTDINMTLVNFNNMQHSNQLILALATVFIVAGLAFKLGGVPFHSWVPDVYQGGSLPVVTYIGAAPKIAALAMAINILILALPALSTVWQKILLVIALLSLGIGNLVALRQINLKRMLGYSAISHAGFILLGLLSGESGLISAMFYTIVYGITTVSMFGILMILQKNNEELDQILSLKGLAKRNQWLALLLMIIMFSMAGVPIMAGFYAKFFVIMSALQQGLVFPVVFALIFSVVGLFYYLRIVKIMYFDEPDTQEALPNMDKQVYMVLSFNVLLLIIIGVYPSMLIDICKVLF